jgi:hypothetical protein
VRSKAPYHHDHSLEEEEEEPIYVPRSIMADIIYKNEDDLVKRRHRASALVELPSGAWQKRLPPGASTAAEPHLAPGFSPQPVAATTALPASEMSGLRQRRGRAEGGGAAEKAPQPEVMVIHRLTNVLLLLADFMQILNGYVRILSKVNINILKKVCRSQIRKFLDSF